MSEQPETPEAMSEISNDDKLWAALGYPISLIALVVLFIDEKKNRPFIKYHAIQALALNLVLYIVMFILGVTVVGAICAPLVWLVTLWPAYKSYQGEYLELPVITDFLKNQGWIE